MSIDLHESQFTKQESPFLQSCGSAKLRNLRNLHNLLPFTFHSRNRGLHNLRASSNPDREVIFYANKLRDSQIPQSSFAYLTAEDDIAPDALHEIPIPISM